MCVLANNYWKVLLPCGCPPASRGRIAKICFLGPELHKRKTTKNSSSTERLSCPCVTVYPSKLSKTLVLPKLREDPLREMGRHSQVLLSRNTNTTNTPPVATGTRGVCHSVHNWRQGGPAYCPSTSWLLQQGKIIAHGPAPRASLKCLGHAAKNVLANANMDYQLQLCIAKLGGRAQPSAWHTARKGHGNLSMEGFWLMHWQKWDLEYHLLLFNPS